MRTPNAQSEKDKRPYSAVAKKRRMKTSHSLTIIAATLILASTHALAQQTHVAGYKIDLGISIGTDGIGIDISTPINDMLSLRAGFTGLPHFQVPATFTFGDNGAGAEYNQETSTEKMIDMLRNTTGLEVDDKITMLATPTWKAARVLLDVKPLQNRHWHFTAGMYLSPRTVATVANAPADASTITSVSIYNYLYDQAALGQPLISMGDFDLYSPAIQDRILRHGRLGVPVGTFPDGSEYILYPSKEASFSARVKVPAIKPYLGAGYEGNLLPGNPDFRFSVDGGLMLLYKTPSVVMHDGTDIVHDLSSWNGRLQPVCRFLRGMYAYPVVTFRVSHKLF